MGAWLENSAEGLKPVRLPRSRPPDPLFRSSQPNLRTETVGTAGFVAAIFTLVTPSPIDQKVPFESH